MEKKDIQQLIEAMKEVFPTSEMMNKSFANTASKADLADLKTEMNNQFAEVKKTFARMEARLPENTISRLEQVEKDVKDIKAAIGMSS